MGWGVHFAESTRETVDRARELTSHQLGSMFAEKASDRLCLVIANERWPLRLESMSVAEPTALPMVVEFAPPPGAQRAVPTGLNPSIAAALWARVGSMREWLAEPDVAFGPLLRGAVVKARRDEVLKRIGPVRDELERAVAALGPPLLSGIEEPSSPAAPQTCWLNGTVRTVADPRALTEVVTDRDVASVDIPQPLILEEGGDQTGALLRAVGELRSNAGTGRGVTVGVIDSEIALRHPAFQDRVLHRHNYTGEPFGTPHAHGTAVAGMLGANGADFEGVAPEVTIYNYKVAATLPALHGDAFFGAIAIQQALEDGVQIVNCSWGAGVADNGSSREARACDAAWELGLTIVKSAGNGGPGAQTITTPADAYGVIVVGATDRSAQALEQYSSRGPTTDGRNRPHLLAPGGTSDEGLQSTLATGGIGGVGYGTSFAAPQVTGLLALMLAKKPELMPADQREQLLAASVALPGVDPPDQGAGVVEPARLLT